MHIPENYLSPMTCAAMGAVMLPIWYKAVDSYVGNRDFLVLPYHDV